MNFTTRNESNTTMADNEKKVLIELVIYTTIAISICGLLTNGFLMLVFAVDPLGCLRNVASSLILNLSLSDFFTALMLLLWNTAYWKWASEVVTTIFFYLVWLGYTVSFLTIVLLSLERYIAIRYIWSANRIVTKRRTYCAIATIWLTSGIPLIPLSGKNQDIQVFVMSSFFELCILLVTIFYGKLLANRWNQVNREHKEHMKQETKLTKVVFMLIALLVITTVPTIVHYQVIYGLALFCGVDCVHENLLLVPVYLTPLFSANFAINPIVYAWRLPKYRRSFLALWKSIFLCKNKQFDGTVTYHRDEATSLEITATPTTNGSYTSL